MQLKCTFWIMLAVTSFECSTECARILGIFVGPGKSHMLDAKVLFRALSQTGHDLTVVSRFPEEKILPNYRDIVLEPFSGSGPKNFFSNSLYLRSPFASPVRLMGYGLTSCRQLMEMSQIRRLIESNETYDLLIIEYFFNECLYGLHYKFKAPIILYSPNSVFELLGDAVGNPSFYSYIPDMFTSLSDHMSFYDRLYNTILGIWYNTARYFYYIPKQNELLEKTFINFTSKPNVLEVERNISLVFMNSHPIFHYPRPLTHNTILLGGLHIKPSKELPQSLQEYLDKSEKGVVYFNFGSVIKYSTLPEDLQSAFISCFSKLELNVLWKCGADHIPGLPKNVRIEKWLPQQDILERQSSCIFHMPCRMVPQ